MAIARSRSTGTCDSSPSWTMSQPRHANAWSLRRVPTGSTRTAPVGDSFRNSAARFTFRQEQPESTLLAPGEGSRRWHAWVGTWSNSANTATSRSIGSGRSPMTPPRNEGFHLTPQARSTDLRGPERQAPILPTVPGTFRRTPGDAETDVEARGRCRMAASDELDTGHHRRTHRRPTPYRCRCRPGGTDPDDRAQRLGRKAFEPHTLRRHGRSTDATSQRRNDHPRGSQRHP